MADFRKVFVLAALVLMLGASASAQVASGAFACTANAAVPPTLRSEGLTELVGDIVLDCTGGTPVAANTPVPQVNFTIFLNTQITSKILVPVGSPTGTPTVSEALLIVDEPGTIGNVRPLLMCASANGCPLTGKGLFGGEPYDGTTGRPNVFQGIVIGNQVQFLGVPVDAPGTNGSRVFRFTNIRANANSISPGSQGIPGQVQAFISASGSTSVPINAPTQVVGFVQPGMSFSPRQRGAINDVTNTSTNISFPQCTSLSRTGSASSFILEFTEGFASSFKVSGAAGSQSVPGTIYNTESGFTSSATGQAGIATHGTRLKAVISNIPAGVSVWASLSNYAVTGTLPGNLSAQLITNEIGPSAPAAATNTDFVTPAAFTGSFSSGGFGLGGTSQGAQIPVIGNTATAVWEVQGANPLSTDKYYFTIWFSYSASASTNSPAPGTATVTGSFAPTQSALASAFGLSAANVAIASTTLPIPRFADSAASGNNPRAIFITYLCRTNLMFPFVTNASGFDTGLAIANTSLDTGVFSSATAGQTGKCQLFAFGDNAPASQDFGTVAPGKVVANLASTLMPNFQGYVIAQCAFQYAHGFAFISDFGARNLAMGYLALVIPEPGTGGRVARHAALSAADGQGEQLGN